MMAKLQLTKLVILGNARVTASFSIVLIFGYIGRPGLILLGGQCRLPSKEELYKVFFRG